MELRIEMTPIDITSLHEPDPNWSHGDRWGHIHGWIGGLVPTLRRVIDVPAGNEYPELSHEECRHCQEVVEPGYRLSPYRRYAPGPKRYYVNDQQVSQKEYDKVLERFV